MLNIESGIKDILENSRSLLSHLTSEEKEELEQYMLTSQYKRNEVIFKEGDKPAGFLILVSGKVKIFKEGVGGREQIIRMAKPFEVIGFRALFADENHLATAVSIEESVICSINQHFIITTALKNYSFSKEIIKRLCRELGFANSRTVSLTQKHIRGRLAESLILLKDKYGYENDGVTLKVYLSREDIANLSNMTTSNAIRTLSTFANEKVIDIDGRKIKILDFGRLDRISKLG